MFAAPWLPFGPDGGDARRFAADPRDSAHIYLGTANGWLYETRNSGGNWHRLSRPGKRDDLVIDGIVVDPRNPRHLIVGAWVLGSVDGGLYISQDGGSTWTNQAEMRGQSVRALTSSLSDPNVIVAGTLSGVYRSTDGGQRWSLISPPDSAEIHKVQSVAVDPNDSNIIYAGTWHLPWKTTDGGQNWANIKQGIIDDSDVFSIIVDPASPKVVYASACSGIYKSEDAGEQFRKVEGIPSSARRTRVLLQDPSHLDIVFAGTTEGLFRTENAGKAWARTTDAGVIVNDVYVDRQNSRHILLAIDRGGVLASDDGGDTFHTSDGGFSARQILTMKRDTQRPATIFVGVVNDKEWGGIFQSDDGGQNWMQRSEGLEGRDVFSLGQAPNGTMIAGTAHGIYRLDAEANRWNRVEQIPGSAPVDGDAPPIATRPPVAVVRNEFAARKRKPQGRILNQRTSSATRPGSAKARPATRSTSIRQRSTKSNLKFAQASGRQAVHPRAAHPSARASLSVKKEAPAPAANFFNGSVFALVSSEQKVLASTSEGLLTSSDDGATWQVSEPKDSADWRLLASAKRNVVAATLHSLFFSSDSGASWAPVSLPPEITQVGAIAVEPSGEIWVGGREGIFASADGGSNWSTPKNLFLNAVTSIYYDDSANRILVTAGGAQDVAFSVQLPSKTVTYTNTGWNLRFVRPVGDHLVGVTFYDGIVIQPHFVASPPNPDTASR